MNILNVFNKKDPSIIQGNFYNNYNAYLKKKITPELNNLQVSGLEDIDTVIECLDTQLPKVSASERKKDSISYLEDKFSRTLAEYNSTQKIYMDSILEDNKIDKNIQKYLGKVVTVADGNYSYVNDYGYTHKFSNEAWSNKVNSCSSSPVDITKIDYNKFKLGPDMGIHQPCGLAGKNVKNIKTKEYAWIDIKGYLHIYPENIWDEKDKLCDTPVTEISNSDFISFPQGAPMSKTNKCLYEKVDPNIQKKLDELNKQLISLSSEISERILKLSKTDKKLNNEVRNVLLEKERQMKKFKTYNKEINKYNKVDPTIDGKLEDTELNKDMEKMHKFMWFVLRMTIISITLHAIFFKSTKIGDIIGLIAALVLVFIVSRWLWNKFTR